MKLLRQKQALAETAKAVVDPDVTKTVVLELKVNQRSNWFLRISNTEVSTAIGLCVLKIFQTCFMEIKVKSVYASYVFISLLCCHNSININTKTAKIK